MGSTFLEVPVISPMCGNSPCSRAVQSPNLLQGYTPHILFQIEYGVYGDIIIYPKPYSIYLRGTIAFLFMLGFQEG